MSIALATTWEERLQDLGNIPASRVRTDPAPGTATIDDVTRLRNCERRLYELVDGTLVEKSMGWQESLLAGILLQWLNNYLDIHRIGVATGADGMTSGLEISPTINHSETGVRPLTAMALLVADKSEFIWDAFAGTKKLSSNIT